MSIRDVVSRGGGEYDDVANVGASMSSTVKEMGPRGHYLAHEVGRLAGVSGQTIGQWARRGYVRSSQSSDAPRVYSYQDVAEAMVVHELRERGVDFRRIRETIRVLRERTGNAWPLTHARIATVDGRVVTQDQGAIYDLSDIPWHQRSLEESDLNRIASDLRRGGWAARGRPDITHIEVNPDRLSGRPVISGTRVPADVVAELAETAGGRDEAREGYGVDDAQIDGALTWWHATQEFEAAA